MPISTCYRLIVGMLLLIQSSLVYSQNQPKISGLDTLKLIAEEEQRRLIDPATGTVPYERLDEARRQLNNRLSTTNVGRVAQSGIPNITWQERGPSNIGGRTRALLFDPNDPAHKKVWAGSPAGGLWYTNDITDVSATWTPVSDGWENTVVTALAADPSNPQVMYAGTGDAYNYVTGGGIWKTTNGGSTWTRLTSTIPSGNAPTINYSFGYIQRIIVNSSGQVFAASRLGAVRSTDGGTSWAYALAPNQGIGAGTNTNNYYNDLVTDLELATDGTLYAAFNPSRIFKSTSSSSTVWTEITPAGITGERTELALAPSTNGAGQVVYAVSRAYNSVKYYQDIKWFKKSTNGGSTWTDVSIPTFSSGDHFSEGNGNYALNLAVNPIDANTIYAGGYDWFRSIDGGNTWSSQLANRYINQQGIWFQPGNSSNAAFADDKGIRWSTDWGNNAVSAPTFTDRNTGYRVAEVNSVSMRPIAGSSYLLGTSRIGAFKLTAAGVATGSVFYSYSNPMGLSFIDEDSPTNQVFLTSGGSVYFYDGSSLQYLLGVNSSGGMADYDSQSNTLYTNDYVNNQYVIRKIAGIGSNISTTTLSLSGLTNSFSYFKLNTDRTALFAGNYPGKLYKITNLNQATPTVTAIDNGTFSQYITISSIDVGATDDELLVTLSNFGVQSIWYTNDGGNVWTGKDQTNFGLPDVPVRTALFNPQNRKQVLLGTDVGIWSTTDITASNPGWAFSGIGLGTIQVNQLRYRASDGRMSAATNGRGIWTTDAFAIPYTLPTVSITNISNATLCAGNTFTVSFSTGGPAFGTGNKFEVWVSDANGNFTSQLKIGSSTTSPISATLPSGYSVLPYGTNYQVKVIATNPDVESGPSSALVIGNLGSASLYDRRTEVLQYWNAGTICTGSKATLKIVGYTTTNLLASPDNYQWSLNGSAISGATSVTLSAQQAGVYTATVKQGGCTITSTQYTLSMSTNTYSQILSTSSGQLQCDDHPQKLFSSYPGETANYQWMRDGVDITGATSYTYNAMQTGGFSYRVTDGSCSHTASPLYLQFGRSLFAGVFLGSPDSLLCASSPNYSIQLYATPSSSSDNIIQWYRNGIPIQNATSTYYYAYQPGAYSILLKQGNCQTNSNAIIIKQTDQLKASISYSYPTKSACPGEIRYLYANPSSNATIQWQKDGVDIVGATNYSYGATTSGAYTVRIIRGDCSAISAPLSLTFSNSIQPSLILNWSAAVTGESCYDANPYINDRNTLSGYQYQWYRNGTLLSSETYSGIITNQSGLYSVRVTNGSCTGLSKEIYVSNKNGKTSKSVVTMSPNNAQLCQNNSLQLTASLYMGYLQWKRNGVPIPGATSTQFYATQSGLYTVVNQDGSCTAESDPIDVRIGEATTATLAGNALVTAGQSTLLPVSFTGPAPWSFTLTNGQSVTATYQNPAFIAVSPTSNTTYQLASVVNACGTGAVSGQANVSVGTGSADVSLNMVVSNRTPNVGDVVSYTLSASNAGPDNAVGVQISSLLPAGLSFVSATSPGVSAANGVVSANLGAIQANGTNTISFQATPTQPGVFATAAQIISSQTPDPDSQPNSGTGDGQDDEASVDLRTPNGGTLITSANPNQVPLPVVSGNQPVPSANMADLSLAMQLDKLTPIVAQNEVITTTLTVNNRGGSSASSVIVQVVLPNGLFNAQSPAGWIQVNSLTYKRYINSLAAGQSTTLSLKWQPAGSGTLKAQILDVAEADSDSIPGNGYTNGEDDEAAVTIRTR